jgi:hypothetical protein
LVHEFFCNCKILDAGICPSLLLFSKNPSDCEIELVKIPAPSKWQQWLHPDFEEDDDDMQCSFATLFWQSLFNFVDPQGIRF